MNNIAVYIHMYIFRYCFQSSFRWNNMEAIAGVVGGKIRVLGWRNHQTVFKKVKQAFLLCLPQLQTVVMLPVHSHLHLMVLPVGFFFNHSNRRVMIFIALLSEFANKVSPRNGIYQIQIKVLQCCLHLSVTNNSFFSLFTSDSQTYLGSEFGDVLAGNMSKRKILWHKPPGSVSGCE